MYHFVKGVMLKGRFSFLVPFSPLRDLKIFPLEALCFFCIEQSGMKRYLNAVCSCLFILFVFLCNKRTLFAFKENTKMCLQLDHPTVLNTSYNGQCTSGKLFKLKSPVCQIGRKLFSLETCNYVCSTNFFKDLFSKAKLDASPLYLMYSLCRPFYSLYSTKEKLFLHHGKSGMLAFGLPSDHLAPGMKKSS